MRASTGQSISEKRRGLSFIAARVFGAACMGLALVTLTPGCVAPENDPALTDIQTPWDLTIQLHITGQDDSTDPRVQTSQYVIDPSRRLRVATGAGAKANYFPGATRVVSVEEFENLGRFVREAHLEAEPTSPVAEVASTQPLDPPTVSYEVEITAFGRRHRYTTTPQESPPTAELAAMLAQLRGQTVSVPRATAAPVVERSLIPIKPKHHQTQNKQ
jgi:hypothetical protein